MLREEVFNRTAMSPVLLAERNLMNKNSKLIRPMPGAL